MTREITTPIVLAHKNIVPGSEIVSVKGSSIPKLIRNSDYLMDYTNGELRFISDGAGVDLSNLIEENGLDVQYSYRLDFSNPELFESQKEVFDEVVTRVSPFVAKVKYGPINDVSRLLNLSTQEIYDVVAIDHNEITFSGINPPRLETLERVNAVELSSAYKSALDAVTNTYQISYPSRFTPNLNPISTLNSIQSKNTYMRTIFLGGQDFFSNTVELSVPLEVVDIQLVTGSRTLRRSNVVLQKGVDFSTTFEPKPSVIDHQVLKINLTSSAEQKIRTNSLYMKLIYTELVKLEDAARAVFSTTTHPVNEVIEFDALEQPLVHLFREVAIGDIVDELLTPPITVLNPDTEFVYEEGKDYILNITQKKIKKLSNGRIGPRALVIYKDTKELRADFSLVADIVLADYVWGTNSINWSTVRKQVAKTEIQQLNQDQQFITLTADPLDYTQVLVYFKDDYNKVAQASILSYNVDARRLQIEPMAASGQYAIEYIATSEPIPQGTPYFASYKYGATRRTVQERFARLMGLEATTTQREEVKALAAGQTSTTLSRSPTELDTILIFNEGDSQETPIATATNYNNITGQLTFTSLPSSGRKVIRYLTNGFDTSSLRKALVALFESFNEGPTKTGYENIIGGFVESEPLIESGAASRFLLPNSTHTQGNQIADKQYETSPPLSNGASSITFQPARFNLGALFETSKGSFVKAPVANNVSLLEGTIEMLIGVAFIPNDSALHYFFDIGQPNSRRNRISLYKSKQNSLNFDIWDSKGQLFRTSADVRQVYFTEILDLQAGVSSAIIEHPATPAQIDLNDNQTPDFYEGLETRFIIMPETNTFPPTFKKASIKVLKYDPPTRTVTFEPVPFSGRYVFSYVTGLPQYEETENFIAVSWKLHTLDGEAPFYKLYINGVPIVNQRLANIEDILDITTDNKSRYDAARYEKGVYEE